MKTITTIFMLFILMITSSFAAEYSEKYKNNETLTYQETIDYYNQLAETYEPAKLIEYGYTDSGIPLQLFVISQDGNFDPDSIKKAGKITILINNAIHAGEPCGVDASAKLAKDLLESQNVAFSKVVLCIIPAYNIGGMLNRSCCSRANQNGPKEYGFRGNAKNLDLNRDFIKADGENTKQFYRIFHDWKPEFFVDAHSTNGADYPADITLISSARSRLNEKLNFFFTNQVTFYLYNNVISSGFKMSPYYHLYADSISQGLKEFMDTPRYSTGYTNLFNTLGFVTEAHMLKPYQRRVEATIRFIETLISYSQRYSDIIRQTFDIAISQPIPNEYGINYKLDTNTRLQVQYESYKRKDRLSTVTGLPIHYYDKKDRDTSTIPYYANYKPTKTIQIPEYYIVPQQWQKARELLDLNQIKYSIVNKDSVLKAEIYYIADFETSDRPYEGHYFHYNTKTVKDTQLVNLRAGDLIVPVIQPGYKYLLETLEPEAEDSFFSWNFFDATLQQKEWFSDYVFEPKAEDILVNNKDLKEKFEAMKKGNKEFSSDSWAMLYFIYKNSKYYEKSHNRYPIYRIPKDWK